MPLSPAGDRGNILASWDAVPREVYSKAASRESRRLSLLGTVLTVVPVDASLTLSLQEEWATCRLPVRRAIESPVTDLRANKTTNRGQAK